MAPLTALTPGAVSQLIIGDEPDQPVLQCTAIKKLNSEGRPRYRMQLSDGVHSFGTTMLATQLNHLVDNDELNQFAIIRMTKFHCTRVQGNKLVVICVGVDVLHDGKSVGDKIGDPVSIGSGQASQQQQAAKPAANVSKPNQTSSKPPMNNLDSPQPTRKLPWSNGDGPTTPGGTALKVVPIQSLTPYQNRWTIRARVTNKGQMKEWKNSRGEGKLFSFTVTDESGSIRITCFNEEAVKFLEIVEVEKVYTVSNATLKPANQQYNSTSHDYEMTLRKDSVVAPCHESDSKLVPSVKYDFVAIKELPKKVNKFADVIGIIKEVEEVQTIMIKSQNREASVRKFQLVDQSNAQIRVTLWGKDAENFEGMPDGVIAFRSAKISDFGTCSLSTTSGTSFKLNPDIPEAHSLKQWYAAGGLSENVENLSNNGSGGNTSTTWKTLGQVKQENLGFGEKPDYVTSKVTILYCKKENSLYQACPSEACNKKVIDLSNGQYRCEKCNTTTDNFKYRMILNVHVADEYDSQWVTCFPEQGELLLGMTSQQLGELKESDETAYENALRKMYFTSYFMKLRVKAEHYNDEQRIRVSIVNLSPISYSQYNKKLMSDLQQLNAN